MYNGYFLCVDNALKYTMLRFGRDIYVPTKMTVLGLFNFRSFLDWVQFNLSHKKELVSKSKVPQGRNSINRRFQSTEDEQKPYSAKSRRDDTLRYIYCVVPAGFCAERLTSLVRILKYTVNKVLSLQDISD